MSISEGFEKYYYLTVTSSCSAKCHACRAQNNLNPHVRDEAELKRAFERIRLGHYQAVVLPPNFLDYPLQDTLLRLADEAHISVVYQIHRGCYEPTQRARIEELVARGVGIEIIFDDFTAHDEMEFWWFETRATHTTYTFLPTRTRDALKVLKSLPTYMHSKLHLYGTPEFIDPAVFLSCDEIQDLLARFHHDHPDVKIKAPLGVEIWDPRIPAESNLEPRSGVEYRSSTRLPQIRVSAILITHQNKEHLVASLTHLTKQKLNRDFYEIIVVDDGSDDHSFESARELIQALPNPVNFKYIKYPRSSYPLAPIGGFRTGPARNLGARHAEGEVLVFLDSHLLCPKHFLEDVAKQHRSWDVVQYQRFFLKKSVSSRKIEYSNVDLAVDSQVSRGGFWERFYMENDWRELPHFWKYLCFSGLSVKASLFQKAGGCLRTYLYPELEGPFFGYKLSLLGLRWKLRNLPLYELAHEPPQSRFERWRNEVSRLRESARLIYLNTLEPAVYYEFFVQLGNHQWLRRAILQLSRLWAGHLLLKPIYNVLSSLRSPARLKEKVAILSKDSVQALDQLPSRFLSPFTKSKLSFLERSKHDEPRPPELNDGP